MKHLKKLMVRYFIFYLTSNKYVLFYSENQSACPSSFSLKRVISRGQVHLLITWYRVSKNTAKMEGLVFFLGVCDKSMYA